MPRAQVWQRLCYVALQMKKQWKKRADPQLAIDELNASRRASRRREVRIQQHAYRTSTCAFAVVSVCMSCPCACAQMHWQHAVQLMYIVVCSLMLETNPSQRSVYSYATYVDVSGTACATCCTCFLLSAPTRLQRYGNCACSSGHAVT